MTEPWLEARIDEGRRTVERLLLARAIPMRDITPSAIPTEPGIYVFTHLDAAPGQVVRAGRATGQGGLRQRIYGNHLIGNQAGNLRSQLVAAGEAAELAAAKSWIRQHLAVRYQVMGTNLIPWAEHFMLAVLRPRFSD